MHKGLGLCCLMTPGLSKDIQCRTTILFLNLQITRSNIRPHTRWAVSLVIVHDHMATLIFLRVLCGCIWVNTTHFITTEGVHKSIQQHKMHMVPLLHTLILVQIAIHIHTKRKQACLVILHCITHYFSFYHITHDQFTTLSS